MVDKKLNQDVELDDENEVMEEAHDPKNAETQSIASVVKAAAATKKAAGRKGDKSNSESADKATGSMETAAGLKKEGVDVDGELSALMETEATLSEEFKEKTAVLFEAALNSRLSEEIDRLESEYSDNLAEEVATLQTEMVEKVDGYLNYVVEKWMEENKLAIRAGLRTEIAEGFMEGLKHLFTESYIEVPESKTDLVDELAQKVESLEEQLNTTTMSAIKLKEDLATALRNKLVTESTADLTVTDAEKLSTLIEGLEFNDETSFKRKISILKEAHFKKSTPKSNALEEADSPLDEEILTEASPMMEQYLRAIRKTK